MLEENTTELAQRHHADALAFWRERLAQVEMPYQLGLAGSGAAGVHEMQLSEESKRTLHGFADDALAEFALFAAGLALLLWRHFHTPIVVFNTPPLQGRGADDAIIPLVIALRADEAVENYLIRVADLVERSYAPRPFPLHALAHSEHAFALDELSTVSLRDQRLHVANTHGGDLAIEIIGEGGALRMTHGSALEIPMVAELAAAAAEVFEKFAHLDMTLGELDTLARSTRRRLAAFQPLAGAPVTDTVLTLFRAQVERTPTAPALIDDQGLLSYAELDSRSDQLAGWLREQHDIGAERMIGILLERSMTMVVAVLAVLKAGAAFVPLDPTHPAERLAHILADTGLTLLLTQASLATSASGFNGEIVLLDQLAWPSGPTPPLPPVALDNLAYVLYTSGSTGEPKGCLIEHRQLAHYLAWAVDYYFPQRNGGHFGLYSSLSFDFTLTMLFCPLLLGGSLRVYAQSQSIDTILQRVFQAGSGIDTLKLTPSHISMLEHMQIGPSSVRKIIVGGEELTARQIETLWKIDPDLEVYNEYGPTETTIGCVVKRIDTASSPVLIGRPIANTRVAVMDAAGRLAPIGVAGEICIGGAGVARGYHRRPELTASRFFEGPSAGDGRMYRTGDLGRWLDDGQLHCLGRVDNQVKVRGHRVELGEIEAVLTSHRSINAAAVKFFRDDRGNGRLDAYISTLGEVSDEQLRLHLAEHLPDYMRPDKLHFLPSLPLTANGKVDRAALAGLTTLSAAVRAAQCDVEYQAPEGALESMLAERWQVLLGLSRVDRRDHFFKRGGHSLLATQLMADLRRQGLATEIRVLFEHPVLADFAAALGGHATVPVPPIQLRPDSAVLTPSMLPLVELSQGDIDRIISQVPGGLSNVQDIYALSPLQEGIFFHHLLAAEGDPYLLTGQLAFKDRMLLDRYLAAMPALFDRHDILRTAFIWEELPTPVQAVWRHAPLAVEEITLDPSDGAISEQLEQRYDPRRHRIDLTKAPLLRFVVAHDPVADRWLLLQRMHHLIGDHATLETLEAELRFILNGRGHTLPTAQPFRHVVAQARLGVGEAEHERFFRDQLADIDAPTMPFGLDNVRRDGGEVREAFRSLSQALVDRLRTAAAVLGVSQASLYHLAWALVVGRTSGRERVVFGTVLLGRAEASGRALGLLINTLPLRMDLDERSTAEAARHTHSLLAQLLRHEHASLAVAQRCSGVTAPMPLFSSVLNYRHSIAEAAVEDEHDPLHGVSWLGGQERSNYPLMLSVEDLGQAMGLSAQVVAPIDPQRVCDFFQCALEQLADALESAPERPLRELDPLPPSERDQLVRQWNQTGHAYPSCQSVVADFERHAAAQPAAIALIHGGQVLSYAELNSRANQLAHYLIGLGVRPDDRLAICVARGMPMLVGLLAILKAGGAYVPLDPGHPAERLAHVLEDAAPRLVLADAAGRQALNGHNERATIVLDLDALDAIESDSPSHDPDPLALGLRSDHLAYVIYTSGSTGRPKGVMVEHRAMVNFLHAMAREPGLGPTDTLLAVTTLSFDIAGLELFLPLSRGAKVVLAEQGRTNDPLYLQALIEAHEISLLQATPVTWRALLNAGWQGRSGLTALCGGEALPGELARRLLPCVDALWNVYGPTETTVWSSRQRLLATDLAEVADVPIGRPIENTQIYVLDGLGRPVPRGTVGEIHIGGAGVARGYLHRDELTAERFLANPFSEHEVGARMYRTGDLARQLDDGRLVYLGRNDQQIKVRGFRIELGEIEVRLGEHPAVRDAVVISRTDKHGAPRLLAYVIPATTPASAQLVPELRVRLAEELPDYMLPAAFIQMDEFPHTPNGKLDRAALPDADDTAYVHGAYAAPEAGTETVLAGLWTELLGVERVGRHDDFFQMGGHSLLVLQLIARLWKAGLAQPSIEEIFERPTLAALAQLIDRQHVDISAPKLLPRPDGAPAPLSFAQQRLWFLDQLDEASTGYHIPLALRLHGTLDRQAWRSALDTIYARHEVLRSVFLSVDGKASLEVLPATGLPLIEDDLRDCPAREAEASRLCAEEAARHFDLQRGPPVRARLIQMAEDDYLFLLTQHHIVADGWSVGVLSHELHALYAAYSQALPDPLPPLPLQYSDYAIWQQQWLTGERLAGQLAYWRERLAGAPDRLDLPTDRPRPPQQSFEGARLPIHIDAELTRALKQFSQQHEATVFMTLLAAWAAVLARYAGQQELVIGSPTANRSRPELEGLIGLFVNTLALRVDLGGRPSVAQLLAQVRATTLAAQTHQDLPFEQVVDAVQPPRRLDHTPLFQVMFTWQAGDEAAPRLPALEVEPLRPTNHAVKFELELELGEQDGAIVGSLSYATALFDRATIERQAAALQLMLRAMCAGAQREVAAIELQSPDELALLSSWNDTGAEYPVDACIHQLFEQQVARTPSALALVFEQQRLSYADLNARANQLARHLRSLGVQPDARVAICLQRGVPMLIGLLAILKAGGAYLPLDPDYPPERLAKIIADASPTLLLHDAAASAALASIDLDRIPSLDLEADGSRWADQPGSNLVAVDLGLHSKHLAYVIYTSGSTGIPKGVQNEHRALVNRLSWMQRAYELQPGDAVLQKTPYSFDVSVWEFFWPLANGARLVMAAPDGHKDPGYLIQLIVDQSVTTVHFVPSMLPGFVATEGVSRCTTLRHVMCSGEALPAASVLACRAALPNAALHNLYGPTEAAIDVTAWTCPPDFAGGMVPIGKAIDNTKLYLLDGDGRAVPLGAVGELYIGGDGVARGYWNSSELTNERFVPDCFDRRSHGRLYRTGDLARFQPDGNLVFLGRNDHQVKIRGFRIELGEIEATLRAHPAVADCAVVARPVAGGAHLLAYVVGAEVSVEGLREFVAARLPAYMVPARFITLDALPLMPNGKLDRNALPAPSEQLAGSQRLPSTPRERQWATIWQEVLQLSTVGVDDNFFELGGDSILSIQVVARAHRLGLPLTARQLFQYQTIAELAKAPLAQARAAPTVAETGETPLLPIDHWFFEQELAQPSRYNQTMLLRLPASIDPVRMEQALSTVYRHHAALHTRFVRNANGWLRIIEPATTNIFATQALDASVSEWEPILAAAAQNAEGDIDIEEGRLLTARLFRSSDGEHRLFIAIHHLAVDGVSWRILLDDLYAAYQGGMLSPKQTSLREWSLHLREAVEAPEVQAELSFWQERLTGAGGPSLSAIGRTNRVGDTASVAFNLDTKQTGILLRDLPEAYGARVNEVLLTALARACAARDASQRVLIDVESHGRETEDHHFELERTVGWFTSIYPLALAVAPLLPASQDLQSVKAQARRLPAAGAHYAWLRYLSERSATREALAALPPAEILFNYHGQIDNTLADADGWALAEEELSPLRDEDAPRTHPFEIIAVVVHGRLQVDWSYGTQLHRRADVEALAQRFRDELLVLLADRPAQAASVEDSYGLSPTQQGMLFHALYDEHQDEHFQQYNVVLHGRLDRAALRRAWDGAVRRHAVLRSCFSWAELEQPIQLVMRRVELPWQLLDWSDLDSTAREERLAAWLDADRKQSFDFRRAPLFRCTLIRESTDQHRLCWSTHHILLDGWSVAILLREVFEEYLRLSRADDSSPAALPVRATTFGSYIDWLSRRPRAQDEAWWRDALAGFQRPTRWPALLAPANAPALAQEQREQRLLLDQATTTRLQDRVRQHRLTLNVVIRGALALLLARYSGARDVVFGATVAGRPAALSGIESMVGLFIHTIPVRLRIPSEASLSEWLGTLHIEQSAAEPHELASLVDIKSWSELARGESLFETLLVFENFPVSRLENVTPGEVRLGDIQPPSTASTYPLTLSVVPGERLNLCFAYDIQRFSEAAISRMLAQLSEILSVFAEAGSASCAALAELPEAEQAWLWRQSQINRADAEAPPQAPPLEPAMPLVDVTVEDEFEQRLLDIWAEVFNKPELSVHDDYFALGGHSLLAVRLMSRIERSFERRLPISWLFDHPTVRQLARALRAERTAEGSGVPVRIRAGGHANPLFLLPGAGGNVIYFQPLAKHLVEPCAIYGLEPPGLDGAVQPLVSVEAVAAHHVKQIWPIAGAGPYRLAGHSYGASVALEMARQLIAKGARIELLAIFDAVAPVWRQGADYWRDWDDIEWLIAIAHEIGTFLDTDLEISRGQLGPLDEDARLELILGRIEARGDWFVNASVDRLKAFLAVYRANFQTIFLPPVEAMDLPIVLFKASEEETINFEPSAEIAALEHSIDWGWSGFSRQPVEVVEVPGTHLSMLLEPQVASLAGRLDEKLERACR